LPLTIATSQRIGVPPPASWPDDGRLMTMRSLGSGSPAKLPPPPVARSSPWQVAVADPICPGDVASPVLARIHTLVAPGSPLGPLGRSWGLKSRVSSEPSLTLSDCTAPGRSCACPTLPRGTLNAAYPTPPSATASAITETTMAAAPGRRASKPTHRIANLLADSG